MLLRDGRATSTARNEERMFEGKDVRHPRTAYGIDTREGKMLWVVVDRASRAQRRHDARGNISPASA
jgi:hypothetical protein